MLTLDKYQSVGQVAADLGINTATVSELLARDPELRRLCPLVSNRRLVPPSAVEMVRKIVVDRQARRRRRRVVK